MLVSLLKTFSYATKWFVYLWENVIILNPSAWRAERCSPNFVSCSGVPISAENHPTALYKQEFKYLNVEGLNIFFIPSLIFIRCWWSHLFPSIKLSLYVHSHFSVFVCRYYNVLRSSCWHSLVKCGFVIHLIMRNSNNYWHMFHVSSVCSAVHDPGSFFVAFSHRYIKFKRIRVVR